MCAPVRMSIATLADFKLPLVAVRVKIAKTESCTLRLPLATRHIPVAVCHLSTCYDQRRQQLPTHTRMSHLLLARCNCQRAKVVVSWMMQRVTHIGILSYLYIVTSGAVLLLLAAFYAPLWSAVNCQARTYVLIYICTYVCVACMAWHSTAQLCDD